MQTSTAWKWTATASHSNVLATPTRPQNTTRSDWNSMRQSNGSFVKTSYCIAPAEGTLCHSRKRSASSRASIPAKTTPTTLWSLLAKYGVFKWSCAHTVATMTTMWRGRRIQKQRTRLRPRRSFARRLWRGGAPLHPLLHRMKCRRHQVKGMHRMPRR